MLVLLLAGLVLSQPACVGPSPSPGTAPLTRTAALQSAPVTLAFARSTPTASAREPSVDRIGSAFLLGWRETVPVPPAQMQTRLRVRVMDAAGTPSPVEPLTLASALDAQMVGPVVAAFPEHFLVLWKEGALLRGTRVTTAGARLDDTPFTVMDECFVGWLSVAVLDATAAVACDQHVVRVLADGTVLDVPPLDVPAPASLEGALAFDVAAGSDSFLLSSYSQLTGEHPGFVVHAVTLTAAGVLGTPHVVHETDRSDFASAWNPAAAWSGSDYLVTWYGTPDGIDSLEKYAPLAEDIYGISVGPDGTPLDAAPRVIFSHRQQQYGQRLVATKTGFFLAFDDLRACPGPVRGDCDPVGEMGGWGAFLRADTSLVDVVGLPLVHAGMTSGISLVTDADDSVLAILAASTFSPDNYAQNQLVLVRVTQGASAAGASCTTGSDCASTFCDGIACCATACEPRLPDPPDPGPEPVVEPTPDGASFDPDSGMLDELDKHDSDSVSDPPDAADAATNPADAAGSDTGGCSARPATGATSGVLGLVAVLLWLVLRRGRARRLGTRGLTRAALVGALLCSACGPSDDAAHAPDSYLPYPDIPTDTERGDTDTAPAPDPTGNLGSDVPVVIEWIVPFPRQLMADGPSMLVHDFAVAPDGSVLLAGERSGTGDVDPGPGVVILSAPTTRPALTRFDSSGKLAWALLWSADFGLHKPLQVAVGPDGTIFVSGMFSASNSAPIDFDPGPATDSIASDFGVEHMFVTRLDPSGAYLGTWTSSGEGTVVRTQLAVGRDGVLWLTGFLTGNPDLDPTLAKHVLHAPPAAIPGLPTEQVPWIATWSAAGEWRWGYVPEASSLGGFQPLADGGAIYGGGYGGGATLADVHADDLDPGPGLDVPSVGCLIYGGSTHCAAQGYWTRVRGDGTVVWSNTFAQVGRDRLSAVPAAYGGTALATPDGAGILLGNWGGTIDFDWGPARLEHTGPSHDDRGFSATFDLFAAGFDAAGQFLAATPLSTLAAFDTRADVRAGGGYSARDKTFHATGWVEGLLIGPAAAIGNTTRPLEGWVGAFDALGRPRWLVGTGLAVGRGGDGGPALRASGSSTVMLGNFEGTVDLDFTAGVHIATAAGPRDYYLVAFHEAPCAPGDTRPCTCTQEPDKVVVSGCEAEAPIFAACDCRDTGPRIDGTFAPPATPDCGPCPAGWVCDAATWLCASPAREDLASGLDHPLEVLDDGVDVYYVVQGHYHDPTKPFEALTNGLWRMPRAGGPAVAITSGQPAYLSLDGGFVYWANGGLFRTPSGGDGTVEVVDPDPTIFGPIAFDAQSYYVQRSAALLTRIRRDLLARYDWAGGTGGNVRRLVVDQNNAYALCESGLYRLSKASWGVERWERLTPAFDAQGLVDIGDALVFTEAGEGGQVRRTRKDTWETELVAKFVAGDIRGPAVRSGDWIYFTRFGLGNAWTWTSEVLRVRLGDGTRELVASSLVHAVGVVVRDGRVLVVEHGETRQTTTLGAIIAFPEPP